MMMMTTMVMSMMMISDDDECDVNHDDIMLMMTMRITMSLLKILLMS